MAGRHPRILRHCAQKPTLSTGTAQSERPPSIVDPRASAGTPALSGPLPHDPVRTPCRGEDEPVVRLEHVGPDDVVANLTGVDSAFAMVCDSAGLFVVQVRAEVGQVPGDGDRDSIFGGDFVNQVMELGMSEVLSTPGSPWQRAYIERVIGTIRRECLDHVLVSSERSLRHHLSDAPEPRPVQGPADGRIVAFPRGWRLASPIRTPSGVKRPPYPLRDDLGSSLCSYSPPTLVWAIGPLATFGHWRERQRSPTLLTKLTARRRQTLLPLTAVRLLAAPGDCESPDRVFENDRQTSDATSSMSVRSRPG